MLPRSSFIDSSSLYQHQETVYGSNIKHPSIIREDLFREKNYSVRDHFCEENLTVVSADKLDVERGSRCRLIR